MTRPVNKIAAEIDSLLKWEKATRNSNWIRHAQPYVDAMLNLKSFREFYGLDSGIEIGRKFLLNSQPWRGDVARRLKDEIRHALKEAEHASYPR